MACGLAALSLALTVARPVAAAPGSSANASADEPITDVTIPPGTPVHLAQTLVASTLTLAGGTLWYFIDDRNVLDWDRPSLKSRVTGSSWRYDSNGFWMNFNGHPLFGAGVYTAARSSHVSVPYAFLTSFATSMLWEFVIEFNERVSINDVVVTPITGMALGEFAHKFGYYLSSAPRKSPSRTTLRWTLSPFTQLTTLVCNDEPRRPHPVDRLGYASGLWHDFWVSQGLSSFRRNGHDEELVASFRASGELVGLPGYREPGNSSRGFWDANVSRLSLVVESSRKDVGVDLITDTILFGHRSKSIGPAGGHEEVVGAALGYRYQDSSARGQDDRRSWVGFPGVATSLYRSRPGLSSELQLRAYPVFGGVSSPAFQLYRKQAPELEYKKVLADKGYFYGWGFAGEVQARQAVGIANGEFALRAESFRSNKGLDRAQDELDDDTETRDLSAALEWSAWLALPHSFVAGMRATSQFRESRAANVRMVLSQRSIGLWLGSRF